jgi:hypothetical protein
VFKIQQLFRVNTDGQAYESGYQACPAVLMACSDTGTIVAMEVFVKEDEVTPMRIGLELACGAIHASI